MVTSSNFFFFISIFRSISLNFIWYRSIFSLFIWPQITLYEKFTNDLLSVWYKCGLWKKFYEFTEYIVLIFSYILLLFFSFDRIVQVFIQIHITSIWMNKALNCILMRFISKWWTFWKCSTFENTFESHTCILF